MVNPFFEALVFDKIERFAVKHNSSGRITKKTIEFSGSFFTLQSKYRYFNE